MADVIEVIGGKESDSSSTSSIIPERTLGLAEMTPLSTGEKQEVNEDDGTEDESGEEDDDDDDDGEEKEDEEPTQEVLEWRAKVEGMHSPNAIRRWYLKKTKKWGDIPQEGTQIPTEPLVFDVKTGFSCVLPMNDMDIGYFEIVVCVSLNDINLESIKSIVIDTNEITKDLIFYDGDTASHSLLKKQEICALPQEDFARLRIHRPAEHSQKDRSQFMGISFITEAGCPKSSFEVHYIELQYCQFRSIVEDKDHIIYGEGRPDQIISVGPDDVPKLPVEVSAFEISDTGEYAVTLYFDKDLAYVDLWDLRLLDNKDTSDQQQQATKPHVFNKAFASATIEVSKIFQERENNSRSLNHSACISSYGKQVSIFIVREDDEDPGLFCVLKANPTAPADKDLSQPWTLEQTKTACKSKRCVLMAYHRTDLNNTDEDAERFYTSDGMNIAVYNTKGSWSLLYALNFQKELDIQTFQDVFFSMKRRYFAWTGSRGAISIWDFETGKLISHIYTGDDKNAAYPVLSPDGSKVALCVRNKVEIRDTMTGIKLGVLKKGVGKENYLEIVFGEEHFLMFNVDASTVSRTVQHNMRSVVRVHDMSIVRTFYMHEDYEFHRPQICHDNVFTYMRGPNVNILRPGPILDPVVVKDKCVGFDNCKRRAIEVIPVFDDSEDKFINTAGTKFLLTSSIESSLGEYIQVFRVREDNNETNPRSMAIPVGLNVFEYSMFFIPETSQLGIVANGCLLLWTLSSDPNVPFCRLKSIWRFQKVPEGAKPDDVCLRDMTSVDSCEHGRNLKIKLSRLQLYRYVSDVVEAVAGATQDTLTVPISPEDTLSATEEYRLNQGFVGLIGVYALGNEECKKTIIRYLKGHIRENRENSAVSPINSICGAWTRDRRPFIESILSQLLPSDRITWVPGTYSSKEDNPLCMILRTAETDASALGVTRIIMDYCVNHANRSRNLAFLSTFFGALHQCMEIYPDEAFERLGRIAYVPVMHRPYILTHSTIARSPQFRLQFWKPSSKSLCTMDDPVLQLDVPATDPDPDNDKFTRPIFMASFDALWYYTDDKKIKGSNSDLLADAAAAYTTTWWKTLYHMIRLKCRLHIHNYVETYDFTIEFYDNPAIAALVAYKWNTIGYWYWFVRFFFQCCFYALVIIASIMQVYYSQPSQLLGLFVAIIVMAVVFIWLELLQAVRSVNRYTKSGYNFLDMIAFSLPLASSIDQIIVINQGDTHGNTHLLSFSVLAVFLHMLFELRINRSVCKYVTIIQEAVFEIRVFFIIFAGGILAFTIATLHLLRSCPYEGCDPSTTQFSSDFVGALFDTYFFMGGKWDPVSDQFTAPEFAFQLMMALFFFFTVILMLNVLIALINVAFAKGDDGWRLVWIESRLRYIESAENMSYHIPGLRQTYNYFPKEIYFSATTKQVHEYREKYHTKDKATEGLELTEKWLRGPSAADDDQDDGDYVLEGEEVDEDVAVDGMTSEEEDAMEKADETTKEANKDSNKEVKQLKITDPGPAHETIDEATNQGGSSSGASGSNVQELKEKTIVDNAKEKTIVDNAKEVQKEPASLLQVSDESTAIRDLNVQVGDLKAQVSNLQKQLSDQLATHQQQSVAQQGQLVAHQEQTQRQLEELKNLLLMRPSTA